ncbi:hypothetical protein F4604DRAFT_1842522 [Suillus subluteus]|nr:hypothetical protein F4604DRAFT_1842522 [Suillus subluteus]
MINRVITYRGLLTSTVITSFSFPLSVRGSGVGSRSSEGRRRISEFSVQGEAGRVISGIYKSLSDARKAPRLHRDQ